MNIFTLFYISGEVVKTNSRNQNNLLNKLTIFLG